MYVSPNYPSKAALKRALKEGTRVTVFSPGPFPAPTDGRVGIEGPHYPKPHSWYGQATVVDGVVTGVK
jgi:hypothetical protein